MRDCPCGKAVRLRAQKVTANRKRGVAHWIEHTDGSPMHDDTWSCVMLKPYPPEADKPRVRMLERWERKAVGL